MLALSKYVRKALIATRKCKLEKARISSILLYSTFGAIGDNLIFTRVIKRLSESLPSVRIDVCGNYWLCEINKYNPRVRYINKFTHKRNKKLAYFLPIDVFLFFKLRSRKYDAMIDLGGSDRLFTYLLYIIASPIYLFARSNFGPKSIKVDIGSENQGFDYIFSDITQLYDYLGLSVSVGRDEFYYPDELSKKVESYYCYDKMTKYVLMNSHADHLGRELEFDDIVKIVGKLLLIHNVIVVLTVTKNGREKVESILHHFDNPRVISTGITSIFELAAFIDRSDVILSPDTGVIHIAAALGKPIVGIYANDPENLRVWQPNSDNYILITPARISVDNNDIRGFSVDETYEAVRKLLN